MKTLFTTILCLFISISIWGQHNQSDTFLDKELQIKRLLANKKYLKEIGLQHRNGVVSYIPIKYHIIGKTNGTQRHAEKKVLELHCALNDFFEDEDEGFQFYIKDDINIIDSDVAYENHYSTSGTVLLQSNKDPAAINIFIPKDANPGSIIGVLSGYYSTANDWLVIRKADADASATFFIARLLGHYFSLLPTYHGWESESYDPNIHGNPVQAFSPSGIPTELMDGSNCEIAGDFICDTPPSYNFFPWLNCFYTGGAMDPNGVTVVPDHLNIMDNFSENCGLKYFSPDQKDIMEADYQQRVALQTSWSPSSTTIGDPLPLIEPLDDSQLTGHAVVYFSWVEVPGAESYLLEIDRVADFSFEPINVVVNTPNAEVAGFLEPEKSYYWRITPFTPSQTCGQTSETNKFWTGTTVSNQNILAVNNWSITPNPVAQNHLVLSMETDRSFDSEISIHSSIGQTLQIMNHHFIAGESTVEIPLNNIPNGMYLVHIKSAGKVITGKIVVAK